jgi:hypothetical protein
MRMLIDVDGHGTVEFKLKSCRPASADESFSFVVEFESLDEWDAFCKRGFVTRNMRIVE